MTNLGGVSGFILPPNECSDNPDGGITCQHGLHTHIIHDDHRCSNGQCWEPGGETNCWDALNWFEIEGTDVNELVTMRERSMCAEVYNSGDPTDGVGGNSPSNETVSEDPADADISIRKFWIREKGGSYTRAIDKAIPYGGKLVFNGKLSVKNKSPYSVNADIDYRVESTKDFDSDDTKADQEDNWNTHIGAGETIEKTTVDLTLRHENDELILDDNNLDYIEAFPLNSQKKANVYLFADVEVDGDSDISRTDSNSHEYGVLRITVGNPPTKHHCTEPKVPTNSNGAATVLRLYNDRTKGQYFSINPDDYNGIDTQTEWACHGKAFNAFPTQVAGTVAVCAYWNNSTRTHEYSIAPTAVACRGDKIFYGYNTDGTNRVPVYLLTRHNGGHILSNGHADAISLRDKWKFVFTSSQPLFWTPNTLALPPQEEDESVPQGDTEVPVEEDTQEPEEEVQADEGICEATSATPTNGGWGWNATTQQGCLVEDSAQDPPSGDGTCEPTSATLTNGGWGWNATTQQGCLVP